VQEIYKYSNYGLGMVHFPHGPRDIGGICIGATLAWIKNVRLGKKLEETAPLTATARNLSVAYQSVSTREGADYDPWNLTGALMFADLRYFGIAISGSGVMVLNVLLTTAVKGVYLLLLQGNDSAHAIGLFKFSDDSFYLFDANSGLFHGSRMDVHSHLYAWYGGSYFQSNNNRCEAIEVELLSQHRARQARPGNH